MTFGLPCQRSQMNSNSMKRRLMFARWTGGKMNDESFLRYDKLLAVEGRNQNIDNIKPFGVLVDIL